MRDWWWCLGCTLVSAAWCLSAATQLSATFDEPVYLARGLEGWRTGSHSPLLRLGTLPLPGDLQTLPLYLWERWTGTELAVADRLDLLLPWARATTLVFWALLLAYGFVAGSALGGRWGGRLAVAWLACEPNLLAHASLATTDVAVSACLLALAYHFATGRDAGWIRRVGLPGVWFAAAVLAKASAVVTGPLLLILIELARGLAARSTVDVAHKWRGTLCRAQAPLAAPSPRRARRSVPLHRDLTAIVLIGLILAFVYCGSDWRAEPSFVAWAHSLPENGVGRSLVWLAEHLRIFSNAGEGIVRQMRHNLRGHGAFLLGQTDPRALWWYFPVLLTIKLSEPLLLAPFVVLALRPRLLTNWACLAAATLLVCSVTFRVQLGVRMVLPLVALAIVGVSAALANTVRALGPGWQARALAGAAGAGVLWTALAAATVWPQGIAYVNRFWGGTVTGYLRVSDSNYDWGQGLTELARWQRERGVADLDVWYFGTDPMLARMPIRPRPLHQMPIAQPADVTTLVRGRHLAASTTLVYGVPWGEAHRHAADFLRATVPAARTTTFLIYDFSRAVPGDADGAPADSGPNSSAAAP
jgi:hypothetical protein